jgi:hypothetical protein
MPREFSSPYLSDATWRIVIVCARCQRRGDYSRATLLAKYGDVSMPELLLKVAADGGCKPAGNPRAAYESDQCRVRYEL